MSKKSKKRNKRYTGRDAAITQPKITRISVPNRSKPAKWWHENKPKVVRFAVIGLVTLVAYLVTTWLLSLIF
jgi:hypothetical protein